MSETPKPMQPMMYCVQFLNSHFHRQHKYRVLAQDAAEAIQFATDAMDREHGPGKLQSVQVPRWVNTDSDAPDLITPAAAEFYGLKPVASNPHEIDACLWHAIQSTPAPAEGTNQ